MESLFNDKFNMLFTSQPGTIELFNAKENSVNVKLDKENYILEDVPISLFGNTNSYITTPTLKKGTKGILIFSKHDLFSWVEDGVDEHAVTDFSKNNAFFLMGATNQKNIINYNNEAIEIKTDQAIEIISENTTNINSNKNIITSAPKMSLNCTTNGEELISLIKNITDELKGLSTALSSATTLVNGAPVPLSNATTIAKYISKFEALSLKFGGFK